MPAHGVDPILGVSILYEDGTRSEAETPAAWEALPSTNVILAVLYYAGDLRWADGTVQTRTQQYREIAENFDGDRGHLWISDGLGPGLWWVEQGAALDVPPEIPSERLKTFGILSDGDSLSAHHAALYDRPNWGELNGL